MAEIFISYAEEDTDLARFLSRELWFAGYRSWMYEREGTAGFSYLREIDTALAEARAMLVIISPASMQSQHVTNEVARAYEDHKPFIPVLNHVSHTEFQNARGDWRMALGTSITLPVPAEGPELLVPRILKSLEKLSIPRQATGEWITGARPVSGEVGVVRRTPATPVPATGEPAAGMPNERAAAATPASGVRARTPSAHRPTSPGTPPASVPAWNAPSNLASTFNAEQVRKAASRLDEFVPLLSLVLAGWSGLSGAAFFFLWMPLLSHIPFVDGAIAMVGFVVRVAISVWLAQAALPVARNQLSDRTALIARLGVFGVVMCVMEGVYALRVLFLGGLNLAGALGVLFTGLVDPRRHLLLGVIALGLARTTRIAGTGLTDRNP